MCFVPRSTGATIEGRDRRWDLWNWLRLSVWTRVNQRKSVLWNDRKGVDLKTWIPLPTKVGHKTDLRCDRSSWSVRADRGAPIALGRSGKAARPPVISIGLIPFVDLSRCAVGRVPRYHFHKTPFPTFSSRRATRPRSCGAGESEPSLRHISLFSTAFTSKEIFIFCLYFPHRFVYIAHWPYSEANDINRASFAILLF